MIWLLSRPLPPSHFSVLSLFLSLPVCRWSSLPTGRGGRLEGAKSSTIPRKSCLLCIIQYSLVRQNCIHRKLPPLSHRHNHTFTPTTPVALQHTLETKQIRPNYDNLYPFLARMGILLGFGGFLSFYQQMIKTLSLVPMNSWSPTNVRFKPAFVKRDKKQTMFDLREVPTNWFQKNQ